MIRILIERTLAEGLEQPYEKAAHQMLVEAMSQPGFISGESLRDLGHPHRRIVLCTWRSAREWERWAASGARRACLDRIRPMLEAEERVTVLQPV